MDCWFSLVRESRFYTESEVSRAILGGDPGWNRKFPWRGKLALADEYSRVQIEDEMTPLFVNLLGTALPEAMATGHGNYPYFEMDGNVNLEIEDGLLFIHGAYVAGND